MDAQVPGRMPGSIRAAMVAAGVQALINGVGGFFLLGEIRDRHDHGQEVAPVMGPAAWLSLAVAAVLAVCCLLAHRRLGWVRTVLLVVQGVAVISGVISLVVAGPGALLGLVLALWIGVVVGGDGGRRWFSPAADTYHPHLAPR
jgi:hypothetical protein